MRHVVGDIDGARDAERVRAPMALDHDAVKAEEDAAVDLARVHLLAQRVEGLPGEEIADLGGPGPGHGAAQVLADLLCRALGGLQGDVAGEALGHNYVHGALAEIIPLDEAVIGEVREVRLAQEAARLLDDLDALDLLGADIEEAD